MSELHDFDERALCAGESCPEPVYRGGLCHGHQPHIRLDYMPPPVCRRGGCPDDAFFGEGYCLDHGRRYIEWRALRDSFEAPDLEGTGYERYEDLDESSALALAIDELHRFFTADPFA